MPKFRGELTMLDGAGGRGSSAGGGPPTDGDFEDGYAGGGYADEPAPRATPVMPGRGGGGGGRARSTREDLDDDIPF